MNNNITQIIKQEGVDTDLSKSLVEQFGDLFLAAQELVKEGKSIKVTDESQVDLMKQARETRLALQKIRTDADKRREQMKSGYLKGANAVQAIFNRLRDEVKPVEEHLALQEKFLEIQEENRLVERYQKRLADILPYVSPDILEAFDLKGMPDETFSKLLEDSKVAHEARVAREKQEAEEQEKKEIEQKLLRERILELAPYRDYIPEEGLNLAVISEEEYKKVFSAAKKAKAEYIAEQERIKKENEKLAKAKVEAERKLQKERQAREEREQKARDEEAARVKAREEQEKAALLAPDKEKLVQFAADIKKLSAPAVKSKEAQGAISEAQSLLEEASEFLLEKAKTL